MRLPRPGGRGEDAGQEARRTPPHVVRFASLASAAVAVVVVLGWYMAVADGSASAQLTSNLTSTVAAVIAAFACFRASRRQERDARGWFFMGLSATSWLIGNCIWTGYGLTRANGYPFPSLADIGFLGFALPAAVGLVLFPFQGVRLVSRARTVIDGGLIASSAVLISWQTVLGPTYRAGHASGLAQVVGLAYPIVDVTMAALVLALIMRKPRGSRLPFSLLGAGLLVLSLTDSVYVVRTLGSLPTAGTIFGLGWIGCWLLIALATVAPHGRLHASDVLNPVQELVPYVPLVGAVVISALRGTSVRGDVVLLTCSVLVLVLAVIRQVLLTSERIGLAVDRQAGEDRIRHQVSHDPLTGLANRELFRQDAASALGRLSDSGTSAAVLFLDLDDFKEVNDGLGHAMGDDVLLAAAGRLQQLMRQGDRVSRFGGDEFAILVEDYADRADLEMLASRIVAALAAPMHFGEVEVFVGASVGIAAATPSDTVEELLRNADLAMYVTKSRGKGGHTLFVPEMYSLAAARMGLIAELRAALEDEEQLRVVFQPKVSLRDGRIVGFEALVRWAHPVRGLVPPEGFIALAERTGLIVELDKLVLGKACRQLAEWHGVEGGEGLTVAVNLSGCHLRSRAVVDLVAAELADSGVPPGCLELELTETVLVDDFEAVVPILEELKALGIALSIDDFGTGYSSLSYLKRFPVASLKIDRSFVDGLGRREQDAALVGAVVAVARALGMTSVAEGVETFEQLVELRALGCDQAQGYFIGKPADAAHAASFVGQTIAVKTVELVLVCDDDATYRSVNRIAFELEGAAVAEAVDGADCLERARALQPDLIVLDLTMPNIDGMMALPRLRSVCPRATIMMVSANTADDVVDQGLRNGAVAFFDKIGFVARIPALMAEYRRLPEPVAFG